MAEAIVIKQEPSTTQAPSTPEELLALPWLMSEYWTLTTDENGEFTFRGRVRRGPGPNTTFRLPASPEELAHNLGSMRAADALGYSWEPVLTEQGWFRRALPDPRSWEESN